MRPQFLTGHNMYAVKGLNFVTIPYQNDWFSPFSTRSSRQLLSFCCRYRRFSNQSIRMRIMCYLLVIFVKASEGQADQSFKHVVHVNIFAEAIILVAIVAEIDTYIYISSEIVISLNIYLSKTQLKKIGMKLLREAV